VDIEPATPDTKDWTWVLERRCPECGLDADGVARTAVAGRLRAAAAAWAAVLEREGVRRRPQPRTWSPLEYGAHVRDLLEVARGRVVLMTAEDDPLFADWDQDATAAAANYPGQDPAAVARALTSAADTVAALLDAVSGDAWQRPGRRSNGSVFTVTSFARYVLHDVEHHLHDVGEGAGPARGPSQSPAPDRCRC
jgi:DinB superfamily